MSNQSIPPLTDLREVKTILEIDPQNTTEDVKISFFITLASEWISEYLGRQLGFAQRAQYFSGTGTQKLLLPCRPVYINPLPLVYVDMNGFYGSTTGAFTNQGEQLTYGTDFCLQLDSEDGTQCKTGIMIRINDYWQKPTIRNPGYLTPSLGDGNGNILVQYSAGYTVDAMPTQIRMACNILVQRLRYVMPLGMELSSDGYEDRNISFGLSFPKHYLMSIVKPMLTSYRNWSW